jgi:hypothetical protein
MPKLLKLISNIEFAKAPLRRKPLGFTHSRKPFAGLRRILHNDLPVGNSAEITHACIQKGRTYKGKARKHGMCELSTVAMNSHLDPKIPYTLTIKHPDGKFRGKRTHALVQKVWKREVPFDLGAENMHGKMTEENLRKHEEKEHKRNGVTTVYEDVVVTDSFDYSTDSRRNLTTYSRE